MPSVRHGSERFSPEEKNDALTKIFGEAGVVGVTNRDEFLIATSVPLERDIHVDRGRGIRYLQRTYTSGELLHRIGTGVATEKRLDCVDSRRMYVKFATGWVLAITADSLRNGGRSDLDKLSEALFDRDVRIENARIRDAARTARSIRMAEANAAAGSSEHLLDEPEKKSVPSCSEKSGSDRWSSPGELIEPFATEDPE